MKVGKPEHFFNRELSWLDFNLRVLEEAEDPHNPLLERLKFLAIVSSNLDEFFMVRVAGVGHQIEAGVGASGPCGMHPRQVMRGITERAHRLTRRQYRLWSRQLRPALAAAGIRLMAPAALDGDDQRYLRRYLEDLVLPVLTPIAAGGPGHPFPNLLSGHLYLAVRLGASRVSVLRAPGAPRPESKAALKSGARVIFVEVPRVLSRFVQLARRDRSVDLVPLEWLMTAHLGAVVPGSQAASVHAVRVTRDADLAAVPDGEPGRGSGPDPLQLVDEEPAEDLLSTVQRELLLRRRGAAVRLEYDARVPLKLRRRLARELELEPEDLYPHAELLQLSDLMPLAEGLERPDLKYRPLEPLPLGADRGDLFARIARKSRLLYHPSSSFDPVVRLVEEAAADPEVLAIKQTLYRAGSGSPIIAALARAAESGKQVTALVELRARFDEERNIEGARRLEEAGAHVIYGLAGLKTHCKALLIVRREAGGIRRYVHLGTGNYNVRTAKVYADFGLLTCDEALGRDVGALFNVITGYTEPPGWEKIEIAPTGLRQRFLALIEREIEHAERRAGGHLIAKVNSLVDREIIEALYRAARAGVRCELIVRGICCLRPGIKRLSENITVRSIVGRFLEHARAFYFANGGRPELYLSSADWMPRNLDRRVELLFPIDEPGHRETVLAILRLQLADNTKARALGPDGAWARVATDGRSVAAQDETYDLLRRALKPPRRGQVVFVPVQGRARAPRRRGAPAPTGS
jgi:polyphosphate kinase